MVVPRFLRSYFFECRRNDFFDGGLGVSALSTQASRRRVSASHSAIHRRLNMESMRRSAGAHIILSGAVARSANSVKCSDKKTHAYQQFFRTPGKRCARGQMEIPPSAIKFCPVTKAESSLASHSARDAISSAVPSLPMGWRAVKAFRATS